MSGNQVSEMILNPQEEIPLSPSVGERVTFGNRSAARAFIAFTALWAMVELPWELQATPSGLTTAALIVAKALFVAIALLAFVEVKWASIAFMVICALSVFAISPSIFMEFKNFHAGFILSSVELLTKGGSLLAMGGWLKAAFKVRGSARARHDFRRAGHR
jgi:hypothetical protein